MRKYGTKIKHANEGRLLVKPLRKLEEEGKILGTDQLVTVGQKNITTNNKSCYCTLQVDQNLVIYFKCETKF